VSEPAPPYEVLASTLDFSGIRLWNATLAR